MLPETVSAGSTDSGCYGTQIRWSSLSALTHYAREPSVRAPDERRLWAALASIGCGFLHGFNSDNSLVCGSRRKVL